MAEHSMSTAELIISGKIKPGLTPLGADAATQPQPEIINTADATAEPAEGFLSLIDGTALAPAADLVEAGGPVVVILLVLSVFTLTIILAKLWQFWRLGTGRRRRVDKSVQLWLAGRRVEAYKILLGRRNVVAQAVSHAMRGLSNNKAGLADVREDVERVALEQVKSLKSWLKALEAVVQIAPLLGLFGTVIGMISAFRGLQEAGSQADPAALAGGIWVALLTTAVGLAVAIPASFVLYWFESIVEGERQSMEAALTSLFTGRVTEQEPETYASHDTSNIEQLVNAG